MREGSGFGVRGSGGGVSVCCGAVLAALIIGWHGSPAGAAPASLDDCIRAALAGNSGLEAARERVAVAEAQMAQARSAWLPRAGVSAGYTLTDNAPQAFMMTLNQRRLNMTDPGMDFNHPGDTDNLRLSAGAQYRLYDPARSGRIGMAREGAAAAAEDLDARRNELIHRVTALFYGVLQAQAFARVQAEAVHSLEENLRVARDRFAAGAVVKTDVLNLEVQLAQGNEELIRVRNAERLALAAMTAALGGGPVSGEGLAAPAAEILPAPAVPPAEAYQGRPELAAARRMVAARQRELAAVRGQYGATVSAFGSQDWDTEPGDDFEDSYMAGVAAEWTLFTGGERKAAVRRAQADLRAAQADLEAATDQLRLDVEQARLQVSDAWERLDVTRKSVESAEESLRITRERYQKGAAPITELLIAQVARTATLTRQEAARYDYLTASSNAQRAAGELFRRYASPVQQAAVGP